MLDRDVRVSNGTRFGGSGESLLDFRKIVLDFCLNTLCLWFCFEERRLFAHSCGLPPSCGQCCQCCSVKSVPPSITESRAEVYFLCTRAVFQLRLEGSARLMVTPNSLLGVMTSPLRPTLTGSTHRVHDRTPSSCAENFYCSREWRTVFPLWLLPLSRVVLP